MVVELIKCLGHSRQINLYRSDLFKLMLHQVVIQISQFAKQLPTTYIQIHLQNSDWQQPTIRCILWFKETTACSVDCVSRKESMIFVCGRDDDGNVQGTWQVCAVHFFQAAQVHWTQSLHCTGITSSSGWRRRVGKRQGVEFGHLRKIESRIEMQSLHDQYLAFCHCLHGQPLAASTAIASTLVISALSALLSNRHSRSYSTRKARSWRSERSKIDGPAKGELLSFFCIWNTFVWAALRCGLLHRLDLFGEQLTDWIVQPVAEQK